jgi:hypothetical protein
MLKLAALPAAKTWVSWGDVNWKFDGTIRLSDEQAADSTTATNNRQLNRDRAPALEAFGFFMSQIQANSKPNRVLGWD